MNDESVLLEKYLVMALGSLRARNTSGPVKALRCNICGDSKSQPNATSAAILNSSGRWVYKCQRIGCEFNNAKLAARWLRKTNSRLYDRYNSELTQLGNGDERSQRIMENLERRRREQEIERKEKARRNAELDKKESKTFRLLEKTDSDLIGYLANRMIDWKSYPFHTTDDENNRFHKCVIIPVLENSKAVFWQGRKICETKGAKYLNKRTSKQGFLLKPMDFDESKPVIVCEGAFSALSVENGICTFGVQYTKEQLDVIKNYDKAVFCYDNDAGRDSAGLKSMENLIKKGHWVILWDSFLRKMRLDSSTNDMNDVAVKIKRKVAFDDLKDCISNNELDVNSVMWM